MSNTNGIAPFFQASAQDLNNALGITQFLSETAWYHTVGGLLIQGSRETIAGATSAVISFNAGFPTQVLGIFTQAIGDPGTRTWISNISTSDFEFHNPGAGIDFYWWAIGV